MVVKMNEEQLRIFARNAHGDQVRKYTGEPYVEHCFAVASMFRAFLEVATKDFWDAFAAAILHDTVEDTDVTIEQIQQQFGDKVAEYVWYLTKPPAFVGNRAKRKELDRARLAAAPDIVKLIKICDIMHNATSIEEFDPKFWETFRLEVIIMFEQIGAEDVWNRLVHWRHKDAYKNFMETLCRESELSVENVVTNSKFSAVGT